MRKTSSLKHRYRKLLAGLAKRGTDNPQGETSRLGVVLSAGGTRGVYAHTGFLLALERMGITVSAAAGCSAGAVVSGIAASGTDLGSWAETIIRTSPDAFWTPDPLRHVLWSMIRNKGRGYSGLSDTKAAMAFFRRNLAVQQFEDCRYPVHMLAFNLDRTAKTEFSQGELAPRMMASAAIPILYKPVRIAGEYYSDGALFDLAPADSICCRHGLDALIVHQVAQHFGHENEEMAGVMQQPWSLLEIVNRLLFHQRPWYLTGEELGFKRCSCGAAIVVLEPQLPDLLWPHTAGGSQVLEIAQHKTATLLQPYLDALLTDPRRQLPLAASYEDHVEKMCCAAGDPVIPEQADSISGRKP